MAVPTYDELLAHYDIDSSIMRECFDDKYLRQFSLTLDVWETLAKFLEMSNLDIANIKSQGDAVVQTLKMLECWKQRRGSMATYEAMVKALLQINRTDLAEKVISLSNSSRPPKKFSTYQILPHLKESSWTGSTSPARNRGIHNMSPTPTTPPSIPVDAQTTQNLVPTLTQLDEEFFKLVNEIESILKVKKVPLNIIKKRFRMLPQSIRRQQETDTDFKATRQKILNSRTTEELFDNLTALKHWSYMMPDTLEHILKDVKIDDIHQLIDAYKGKLTTFKENTKLKELIGISFPVPDYCMELTMEVEGWEDKTIQEVENRAVNIVRRATYSGGPHTHVSLGWKGVMPGSIKVTFILMESVKLIPENLLEERGMESGVLNVNIDGHIAPRNEQELPWRCITATSIYNAGGGRDVLILAPDPSLSHHEAVSRRHGQLTEEDNLNLQRQGLPPDCKDELDIIKARYELHVKKDYTIVEVKSRQLLSRKEVLEKIAHLLNTTQNGGAALHYIGAGRRGTGDWCFEDGFITFRDIAQLYLRASYNFKGRVLTIVSDCSYSGCWVRDCMEFLDEQGVQPCGHKAREKGMIIKVVASCKSDEIPTEYCFSVSGMSNNNSIRAITFKMSWQLLETQITDAIDSSQLNCSSKTIDEPCTLPPGFTWRRLREIKQTMQAW